jgi:AcrR family transcriptional regulator
MSRDERREQLIEVAMPIVAEEGIAGFSLDEVADSAGVTRNLLYHYFPRGRDDLLVAIAERVGHELTDGWVSDESVPLEQRTAINFARFLEHSRKPSLAWRIYRLEQASTDPELQAIIDRFHEIVVVAVSQNNFGTADPPPFARSAIKACMAFGETILDAARGSDVPREEVLQLFAEMFRGTMDAVRAKLAP